MKVVITVGLGFGDEGKGATVDYLTRVHDADLVVRYCGGAQAGHNVELPDGRRHTFAQFGAGTLAGARTYLGPRVIISPTAMVPEAEHLRDLGVPDPFSALSVHPDCLVATHYHACMNRLRESARGEQRHGSCGIGVGEARHYWLRYGQDAVCAADLSDRATLISKLRLLRDRFLLEMQELPLLAENWAATLHNMIPAVEADMLQSSASGVALSPHLPDCRTAVFEGAQGVLLDEWKGFHPYTTWSTVTPLHALELIEDHGPAGVTILGVTRAYSTRHGAGPFPTWSPELSARLSDPGNPQNDWQGTIRFGALDLVLLEYAARTCRIDGLVVNCLDQLPERPRVCTEYAGIARLDVPGSLRDQTALTGLLESAGPRTCETTIEGLLAMLSDIAPVVITSRGPTHRDRRSLALQATA